MQMNALYFECQHQREPFFEIPASGNSFLGLVAIAVKEMIVETGKMPYADLIIIAGRQDQGFGVLKTRLEGCLPNLESRWYEYGPEYDNLRRSLQDIKRGVELSPNHREEGHVFVFGEDVYSLNPLRPTFDSSGYKCIDLRTVGAPPLL